MSNPERRSSNWLWLPALALVTFLAGLFGTQHFQICETRTTRSVDAQGVVTQIALQECTLPWF